MLESENKTTRGASPKNRTPSNVDLSMMDCNYCITSLEQSIVHTMTKIRDLEVGFQTIIMEYERSL